MQSNEHLKFGMPPGLCLKKNNDICDTTDMKTCYKCDEPTIGGLYCACPDHLPLCGAYANKKLINTYNFRRIIWLLHKSMDNNTTTN